jgi:hypothetical protein
MKTLFFTALMTSLTSGVLAQKKGPELTFSYRTFVFKDTILQGNRCECEFEFTNTGDEPLIINLVTTSCGCDMPTFWPKEPIKPGGKGKIGYKYDSNRIGILNKSMTITGNFKDGRQSVAIKGYVKPRKEGQETGLKSTINGQMQLMGLPQHLKTIPESTIKEEDKNSTAKNKHNKRKLKRKIRRTRKTQKTGRYLPM